MFTGSATDAGRFAPAAVPAIAPTALDTVPMVCAAFADADPASPAAAAVPTPRDPTGRCSPAERRPTCEAVSRAAIPDPSRAAADPATDAGPRGGVSRNHPAGATGSVGSKAALFALIACMGVVCDDVAVPVRSTGSACAVWLRGAAAPVRQLAPAPRADASLAAALLIAPPAALPATLPAALPAAPRPPAGGRQTVGRA